MLSSMRTQVPRTNTASQNPLTFQDGHAEMIFYNPSAPYMMTNVIPPGESFFNPPLHLHLFQTELFHIQSGTAAFFLQPSSKNPGPTMVTAGGTIHIPRRAYHRFENGSKTEKLVIDLRLDPQRWDVEECFFRNFFGYLEDCSKAKKEPSIFQLLRFLHGNDTPLAIPIPEWCPEWVGCWLSRIFLIVAGVLIGGWVLGYRESYPEYYRKRSE